MKPTPTNHTQDTVPAEHCYWAVFTPEDIGRSKFPRRLDHRSHAALLYAFEEFVPIDLDQLHVVTQRLSARHTLVCGVEAERLEPFLDQGAPSLRAERIPMEIVSLHDDNRTNQTTHDTPVPPELLTGPFTPRPLRASHRRRRVSLAIGLVLTLAACAVGVERRAAHAYAEADDLHLQTDRVLREALGDRLREDDRRPIGAVFTEQLRRLRAAANPDRSGLTNQIDPLRAAAGVLHAWPEDAGLRLEVLVITRSAMSLRIDAPSETAALPLSDAINADARWKQPTVTSTQARGRYSVSVNAAADSETTR